MSNVEEETNLYTRCCDKVAELLKACYWSPDLPRDLNPFKYLPCDMIDDFVDSVIDVSDSKTLFSSDLRLLINTGRVGRFELETCYERDVELDTENFVNILEDLSASCGYLTEIEISVDENTSDGANVGPALNHLLMNAKKLKVLLTNVKFDLRSLSSSSCLEDLMLHFTVKDEIVNIVKVNGDFKVNSTLKCLTIFEQFCHYRDLAVILTYCQELREIDHDESRSMSYLHADELQNGSLTQKYKLRYCRLGYDLGVLEDIFPSREGVRITAMTCPDLQVVVMLINDDHVLPLLSECKNLEDLHIVWKPPGQYDDGLRLLLEKASFMPNFQSLGLRGCDNVDFVSIGACCLNLTHISISRCSYKECSRSSFRQDCFTKLEHCSLDDELGMNADETLIGLLSRATSLTHLRVHFPGPTTDYVVNEILKVNGLLNLEKLEVLSSGLSLAGWRYLASSLLSLKELKVGVSHFDFGDILAVVKKCNANVLCEPLMV